jgi:tetratricopeptide (TPR) repeat protein
MYATRPILALLSILVPAACGGGVADARQPATGIPLYDDLGTYHHAISTDVPLAQRYFDQGLRLYYAFNHAEAIRSFEEAMRLDPECAMCSWGKALAHGPNINARMDAENATAAFGAIREAVRLAPQASQKEEHFIEALAQRYAADPEARRAPLDSAYARAMGRVAQRYPGDPEAGTLHAEALMDLSPWQYWNRDGTPRPGTSRVLAELERVMDTHPHHPGANHFYIHAVEEVDPYRALPMAERLAGLMPGAGHLVHMPGHIYIRVGRYLDAISANEHAVHADESWIQDQKPGAGMYTVGYYPHNHDFLAFAAAMAGRGEQAMAAADRVAELAGGELLGTPGLDFLQHHLTRALQLRVRFGRWTEILATASPPDSLPHARGMWSYARGRALVATGALDEAHRQLATLEELAADPRLEGVSLEFNGSRTVLELAVEVLAGTLAAARGDLDGGVERLRAAAALEDGMVYGEPPEWTVPVRHDLGRLLLQADRPAEAGEVYREDLARFPENGWSLKGLAASLEASGRMEEAESVEERFRRAWRGADVEIHASSF